MNNENLRHYRDFGFDFVEGWCSRHLFEIVDCLDSVTFNKQGGCLEIGVHHGKFYMLLNSVIDSTFHSFALDVFDEQSLNIDGSGSGSLFIFKDNLRQFDIHKGQNTRIVQADSTDNLAMKNSGLEEGAFRFISIDGGHTVEHTVSDLELASRLLAPQGVVILDDILNHHWLGVIEGVSKFLDSKPTLIPFAIGQNKLLLSKLSWQKKYFDVFANSPLRTKIVKFYGHDLVAL